MVRVTLEASLEMKDIARIKMSEPTNKLKIKITDTDELQCLPLDKQKAPKCITATSSESKKLKNCGSCMIEENFKMVIDTSPTCNDDWTKKKTKIKANDLSTFLPGIRGSIVQNRYFDVMPSLSEMCRPYKKRKQLTNTSISASGYKTKTHTSLSQA